MGNLTRCQEVALKQINDWWEDGEQSFVLGGYAGTGKTFLVEKITRDLDIHNVKHCAFTGKAALALKERGVSSANTVHQLLYQPFEVDGARKALKELSKKKGAKRPAHLWEQKIQQLNEIVRSRRGGFVINPESQLRSTRLLIVDEFSMLNDEIIRDLHAMDCRILFIGDPAQLPPIEGDSPLRPDCFLDEVVRQALDNPVLRAATMVREHKALPESCDWGQFKRLAKFGEASWEICSGADQVLCGKNKTRADLNKRFRNQYGRTDINPEAGDKLVCTENDHNVGLYNGTVGICEDVGTDITDNSMLIDFRQGDQMFRELKVWDFSNMGDIPRWARREFQFFDYGYALTVHKAQGSEWDDIVVFNEMAHQKGWLYTALTRARETATLVG